VALAVRGRPREQHAPFADDHRPGDWDAGREEKQRSGDYSTSERNDQGEAGVGQSKNHVRGRQCDQSKIGVDVRHDRSVHQDALHQAPLHDFPIRRVIVIGVIGCAIAK